MAAYPRRKRAVPIILALICLGLILRWPLVLPWPWQGNGATEPETPGDSDRVQPGVFMAGHDLSRRHSDELYEWLQNQASVWRRDAIPARIDPSTKGVIPELDGFELDVEATVSAVLSSPPGVDVVPRWSWTPADTGLADFPLAPLYQGNPQQQAVTFLVNVAWGNDELLEILEILAAEDVRATFFLVGRWVDAYPELARAVVDHGHEIASHGYSDAISIGAADAASARSDLQRVHDAIVALGVDDPRYFSPHRGELSPTLLEVCRDLNYRLVMWSVDTIDWQDPAPQVLLDRVLTKVQPGSLILMHPRQVTVEALPSLIAELRQRNLPPVPLSELLDPRRQSLFSP